MSALGLQPKAARAKLVTDIRSLRADFPALHQEVHGKPLVYLDSAASSQRPQAVIDAMVHHEQHDHANVHRGVHQLSQRSTAAYEGARGKISAYINASDSTEIIFTRGVTESINLVAASLGQMCLGPGDEVLVTRMEHHSNIVPWQLICQRTGARVIPAPITETGELDRDGFTACLNSNTKIVALGHISNALGTINPLHDLIAEAHEAGALVSIGDTHAAQGDGELAGTAIESPMSVTVQLELEKEARLPGPWFDTPGPTRSHVDGDGYHVTAGVASDLMEAARTATSNMIDLLGRLHQLAPEDAYLL